jgi:glycosyltransferase involved in cell wall biosynthesis
LEPDKKNLLEADMSFPKVSILIPTHNRADLLMGAIESSLAQDYPNLEVIVSDNASKDETQNAVKRFLDDRRFSYHRNNVDIGISGNWRKLMFEYAGGEYVKVLSDDDYLLNMKHASQAVELMTKNGLDIVFSAATLRIERAGAGRPKYKYLDIGATSIVDREWWLRNLGRVKGFMSSFMVFPNLISGSVFKLSKAKELNALDPDVFAMDYELALRFMLKGRAGYIRGPQYVEREHAKNDGSVESFDNVLPGTKIFDRTYLLGMEQGIPQDMMSGLRRRGQVWYLKTFAIDKWLNAKGYFPVSMFRLYNRLREIGPEVAFRTVFSVIMLKKIIKALIFGRKEV